MDQAAKAPPAAIRAVVSSTHGEIMPFPCFVPS